MTPRRRSLTSQKSGLNAVVVTLPSCLLLLLSFSEVTAFSPSLPQRTDVPFQSHLLLQATSTSPISSSPPRYIRWNSSPTCWQMQTAVTTFQRKNNTQTVELHAQLHFADNKGYYDLYNQQAFYQQRDAILYELLVDEELLSNGRLRQLSNGQSPVAASPQDQATARLYNWHCQVDSINYAQPKWFHADWTRQEFLQQSQQQQHTSKPLWQISPLPSAAAEAATALLQGPPILSTTSSQQSRRLFTNLFLPGNALATGLRALLWMTIPSPEISILILDWSSTLLNSISQIGMPILNLLATGRWNQARQLVFGQVVLSASRQQEHNSASSTPNWNLLVTQRNNHALQVLNETLKENKDIALLYGCSHCIDLHDKLVQQDFQVVQTEWRTAWSVAVPIQSSTTTRLWTPALLLLLYFGIGGMDWIATLQDVAQAADQHDTITITVDALLYLMRHVLFYVGLSKFVLDIKE